MAILTDPPILILDEPTNGLWILMEFNGIKLGPFIRLPYEGKGMTILISSHQLLEISKVKPIIFSYSRQM